jgi:hypothetical protein
MATKTNGTVTRKVLATKTQHLPVPLTPAELAKVAEEMGRVEGDLRAFWAKKKQVSAELKEQEERLDAEMGKFGRLQRDKKEYRPVPVRVEADFRAGKVYEIREDTGEIVGERAVNEQDRQASIFEAGPRARAEPPTAEERAAAERAELEREADGLLANAGAGELAKKELAGEAVARKRGRRA